MNYSECECIIKGILDYQERMLLFSPSPSCKISCTSELCVIKAVANHYADALKTVLELLQEKKG